MGRPKKDAWEIRAKQAIPLESVEAEKEKIKVGDYITLEGDAFKTVSKMTGGYDYTGKFEGRIAQKHPQVFIVDCGNYKTAIRYSALITEGARYKLKKGA